jgi:hypothetical protein
MVNCTLHDSDWRESVVVIGSHRAQLNIALNIARKVGYDPDPTLMFWNAWNCQTNHNLSVQYNIQWHLIVTDPEFMLACLNDALGTTISYTPLIQQVFQQYINSCWPTELQGDAWLAHPYTQAWIAALKKRGLPEEEVYNHWVSFQP